MPKKRACGEYWRHDSRLNSDGRMQCVRCAKLNPLGVGPEVRFWDYVNKSGPNGCWLWMGGINRPNGYGLFQWPDKKRLAHHVAWFLKHGEWPEYGALEVDHRCHERLCVNTAHMERVTHMENMKRRRNAGLCKQGHPMAESRKTYPSGRSICGWCWNGVPQKAQA